MFPVASNQQILENLRQMAQIRPLTEQERRMMQSLTQVNLPGISPRSPVLQQESTVIPGIYGRNPSPVRRSPSPVRSPVRQQESTSDLFKQSYETLLKQLYGIPVMLPEFLIINGLRASFISFNQLSSIQIERYIIDPMLQPWAGAPGTRNRIVTIFGRNGITYLVKALHNPQSNQIFPPV